MDIIKRRVSSDLIEKAAKLQPEQYELSDKGNARLFADMYRDCLRYNSTARRMVLLQRAKVAAGRRGNDCGK